jgi:hypothetical protein
MRTLVCTAFEVVMLSKVRMAPTGPLLLYRKRHSYSSAGVWIWCNYLKNINKVIKILLQLMFLNWYINSNGFLRLHKVMSHASCTTTNYRGCYKENNYRKGILKWTSVIWIDTNTELIFIEISYKETACMCIYPLYKDH